MGEKEFDISLQELFKMFWHYKWFIMGVTLIAALAAAAISVYVLDPVYQAESTLLVTSRENEEQLTLNDLTMSNKLVSTYSELIKSNRVLDEVNKELNLNVSVRDLKNRISISVVRNTEILRVQVKDANPNVARDIANTIVVVFKEQLPLIYTQSEKSVSLVDEAKAPTGPVEPKKTMNVMVGFLLGGLLSAGIVFLREFLRNTFRSPKDIELHLGIPVIGTIPSELKFKEGGIR